MPEKNSKKLSTVKKFGDKLKLALKENGYSQNQFAKQLIITQPALSQFINDVALPRPYISMAISHKLNLDYQWFLYSDHADFCVINTDERQYQRTFQLRLSWLLYQKEIRAVKAAREIGITPEAFDMYLEGLRSPTDENASRLCQYFGVTYEYLFGGTTS